MGGFDYVFVLFYSRSSTFLSLVLLFDLDTAWFTWPATCDATLHTEDASEIPVVEGVSKEGLGASEDEYGVKPGCYRMLVEVSRAIVKSGLFSR